MSEITKAPWTPERVAALWRFQMAEGPLPPMHPFTCGRRNRETHTFIGRDYGMLIPTVNGWVCAFCDYTQDWAHKFMLGSLPDPPNDQHGRE